MPERAENQKGHGAVVELWETLLRVHAAVTPVLADVVESETGLPLSWYDVLLELTRTENGRLRMQDLGERVVLSRSRVSRVVDEMVAEGLVAKQADPADGRATLASLTTSGRRAIRRAAPIYLRGIAEHFGDQITPKEADRINTALRRVLDTVDPSQSKSTEAVSS